MTATLLVLLVGELLAPFDAAFREAVPQAFPDNPPEVGVGPAAPPGRNVAWVSLQAEGQQVELVLHTARVTGDLRRVLRFTSEDAPKDRARAAAFTLAAMVKERDAELRALEPPPLKLSERPWRLSLSGLAGMDLANVAFGGGGALHLRREALPWLTFGAGAELTAFQAPATQLLTPALWLELGVAAVQRDRFTLSAVAGAGAAALVLSREAKDLTTWLPVLRLAVEGEYLLGDHHGLRFAVSVHTVGSQLAVQVGDTPTGSVGPAWIRPEIGYFVEL